MTGLFTKQPLRETKTQVILYFCEESVEQFGTTPEQAIAKAIRTLGVHGIEHEVFHEPWCTPTAVVREVPRSFKER